MTNHIHLVVSSEGEFTLPNILRDYKKYTSKTVKKAIDENPRESSREWLSNKFTKPYGFRVWRGDNRPIEISSNHVIDQKINYIHMNPVEEGLVFRPEDYKYTSAIDYAGGGLLVSC